MTPKSLIVLALITAVAVGSAVVVARTGDAGGAIADRGRVLAPDLVAKAGSIASIAVTTGKTTTTLARAGDGFVDATGYPASTDAVRSMLTSIATLTVAEGKTDKPDRYADLGLADPGADKGAATGIDIRTADGKSLVGLFVGTKDLTVGGSRGGQYVRLAGEAESYLVRGQVEVPAERSGWFDNELTDIKPGDLKTASLLTRTAGRFDFVRQNETIALATPPEGRERDEPKFTKLAYMFKSFVFVDVRKAGAAPADTAPSFAIETADGLRVAMTEVTGSGDADKGWVRVTASSADAKSADAAKAIAAKVDGYEFKVRPNLFEIFDWTLDTMMKAPAS
jgi:hypothetical protein